MSHQLRLITSGNIQLKIITQRFQNYLSDLEIMLSHEIILKSKDTEKCMTQLLSLNRKIIQFLSACDTDTYFEDIQTILIFLK